MEEEVDDLSCTLSVNDPWPCASFNPMADGRCATCKHRSPCHDLRPRDMPWRQG